MLFMFRKLNELLKKRRDRRIAAILKEEYFGTMNQIESKLTLRNCQFKFRCTQTWEGLELLDEPEIKHCSICSKNVHFVKTDKELAGAIKLNYCVAIKKARKTNMLIGVIEAKNYDGPAYMRNKK